MLNRLHIKNYILIDSLEIEFPENLLIITGQTGAGKSIILGALSLITGAKADATIVGESIENCVVEAEFQLNYCDDELRSLLEENEVEWDDGRLIIRRVVAKSGRSRAFVNDSPVTVQLLSSLSSKLIDIHSQHQTLLLSDKRFQLSLLDLYSNNKDLLDNYKAVYNKLLSIRSQLSQVGTQISEAERDREYNAFRLNQLEEAKLVLGELEDLETEQKQLAHAEEIKSHLCEIEEIFSPLNSQMVQTPIVSSIKDVQKKLAKLSSFMPELESYISRLDAARLELEDISSELSDKNSSLEVSPSRLEEVDNRISLIYGLFSKFGARNIEELIEIRENLSSLLFSTEGLEAQKDALIKEEASLVLEQKKLAENIRETRQRNILPLSDLIQEKLRFLELDKASFLIELSEANETITGIDQVDFMFSATGAKLTEVSKGASGGEMSRIMLVIKSIMAQYTKMPTMIFDEIDTGVSGSVADKMGAMITDMGKFMQVFAITHLPQVAAKGEAHYLVTKYIEEDKTKSTITKLTKEQRVLEIARMLSGAKLTDAAIENAKSLLN